MVVHTVCIVPARWGGKTWYIIVRATCGNNREKHVTYSTHYMWCTHSTLLYLLHVAVKLGLTVHITCGGTHSILQYLLYVVVHTIHNYTCYMWWYKYTLYLLHVVYHTVHNYLLHAVVCGTQIIYCSC